jgi:TonB-dependent SusC/RagA subfamily outer membrane receptor
MKSRKLLSLALIMLIFQGIFAQEKTITGTVFDKKEPLPYANVSVKGKRSGTLTNIDGKFSIKVNVGEKLQFSYIGFETFELEIGEKITNYTVVLKTNATELNDYYNDPIPRINSKEIQNSTSHITVEELNRPPKTDTIHSVFRCKIPSSIQNFEEPLYVIDGNASTSKIASKLNPENIKSIDVLKGASATSLYGTSAINGVIIISTKNLTRKELRKLKKQTKEALKTQSKDSLIIRN